MNNWVTVQSDHLVKKKNGETEFSKAQLNAVLVTLNRSKNSFSEEGLDFIAKYNNYESKWEEEKAEFNDDTSIADKRFVNLMLYATWRKRRCYHLDPIEGGH